MSSNLIVPVAADKPEYSNKLPYVFALGEDGIIVCIKSVLGLPLDRFDNIYFTVLRKHDDLFYIADSLRMQCKRLGLVNVKIVILDEPTRDQVETVFMTIQQERISGSIYIKDADCYFESKEEIRNGVAIYPIEELEMLDPRDKSYVAVDDMYYITNIIEKSVIVIISVLVDMLLKIVICFVDIILVYAIMIVCICHISSMPCCWIKKHFVLFW